MRYAFTSSRQRWLLFTACGLISSLVPDQGLRAQSLPSPATGSAQGAQYAQATTTTSTTTTTGRTEDITVRAARRLQKEQNSPSAVTELGEKAIAAAGVSGSIATILRQAPSVNLYQQGIGDNAPVLTIRGLRGLEVATTLDGVPIQDLEAPGASYVSDNIGSYVSLEQISGVSIYPGVAYPNRNTFGTIGGTVAYDSLRPSNDPFVEVTGEAGSFQTFKEGILLNSGAYDSPLGTGDNAAKIMASYNNLKSAGFIDYTKSRYNNFEMAFDKPYNDGQSKFQATVLYNTGAGLFENEPVPVPYLNQNGKFSNYAPNVWQDYEHNDFLTVILKDDNYINDIVSNVGWSLFYLQNDAETDTYAGINDLAPTGVATPVSVATTNGLVNPFINNAAGFGYGWGTSGNNFYGPGNFLYAPQYPYNPGGQYPVGSKYCPASVANKFIAAGDAIPCGLNSELAVTHSYTYGGQVRATIDPPEIFGINQSIQTGGLVAKEASPSGKTYYGATPDVQQSASNLSDIFGGGFDGGTERVIFQGYAQDKIDLIGNTLHLTPGATLEGSYSEYNQSAVFDFGAGGYAPYKAVKWDREFLPFFNLTYDLDGILPALKGLSAYGSVGNSALFAPVTNFSPNAAGVPPYASIVHLYEGGITYNTEKLLAKVDYFYQKVDRDFGFFSVQSGPQAGLTEYSNSGQREFKGFEAAITYNLTPEVQIFGNASHTLAKYLATGFAFTTVAEDQYGIAIKGDPVTGVPDWISTFGADWHHKSLATDGDNFDVRITEQYTGHEATTWDPNSETGLGEIYNLNVQGLPPKGPCNLVNGAAVGTGCNRLTDLDGATVYDPNGGNPGYFVTNLDFNYTLPTPYLPVLKKLKFDLNVQNLFNRFYYQYFYKQVSPGACKATVQNPVASNYGCSLDFADGIPGQPFSVFFTVSARF